MLLLTGLAANGIFLYGSVRMNRIRRTRRVRDVRDVRKGRKGKRITRKQKGGGKKVRDFAYPDHQFCHPRSSRDGCFPDSVLKEMGYTENDREKLLEDPREYVKGIDSAIFSEEKKDEYMKAWLRPEKPASWSEDPDMWLDSENIESVMRQYEEAHSDFHFLGTFPIDFASKDPSSGANERGAGEQCIVGEMCGLDLAKEKENGKTKIGIVYNLDPHYKSGSHWVANYIDTKKKVCYYFDSYGIKPPEEVYKFMQWLTMQEKGLVLGFNGRRFQHLNSECGMYCLYFLDRMISGECEFKKFCKKSVPDRFMLFLRNWIYS